MLEPSLEPNRKKTQKATELRQNSSNNKHQFNEHTKRTTSGGRASEDQWQLVDPGSLNSATSLGSTGAPCHYLLNSNGNNKNISIFILQVLSLK